MDYDAKNASKNCAVCNLHSLMLWPSKMFISGKREVWGMSQRAMGRMECANIYKVFHMRPAYSRCSKMQIILT